MQQFVIVSVANDGSSQNFHSSDLLKHFDIFAGESLFYILLYKSNLSFLKYQGLMLNENFQIRRILFKFKDHNYTFYQMSTSNFEFCFLFPTIFSFIFSTNLHLFFYASHFYYRGENGIQCYTIKANFTKFRYLCFYNNK